VIERYELRSVSQEAGLARDVCAVLEKVELGSAVVIEREVIGLWRV
jgi:hypothetical protein